MPNSEWLCQISKLFIYTFQLKLHKKKSTFSEQQRLPQDDRGVNFVLLVDVESENNRVRKTRLLSTYRLFVTLDRFTYSIYR